MLRFMRKHAKFFYIFFFIIIISFIGFYAGPLDQSISTPVAEINNEKITVEEYWRTYDRARSVYRDIYKEKFDDEMEKKLKLKEKVLDTLIEERVLLLAAKDIGIKIRNEELEEAIKNEPAFTSGGVFDRNIYLKRLELNRISPEFYENTKRKELTLQKIRRMIGESIDVSDNEIKQIQAPAEIADTLRQTIINDKRDKAIRSYVEGLKKQMKIKVNSQQIS